MPYPRDEIEATVERYVEIRKVIDDGGATWSALAQYFTDDAGVHRPRLGPGRGHRGDEGHRVRRRDGRPRGMEVPGRVLRDRRRQRPHQVEAGAARPAAGRPTLRAVGSLDARSTRATASSATKRTSSTWCTCSKTCARASARSPRSRCRPSTPTVTSPVPVAERLRRRAGRHGRLRCHHTAPERVRRRGDPSGME